MISALVGDSGFVGSNLLRAHAFDATFRSMNIDRIHGRAFDLLVCAGAPGTKWRANAAADEDRANIENLVKTLSKVPVQRLVLISTVDVFESPIDVDEQSVVSVSSQPYGRHRHWLEQELASRFQTTILRLPALFGPGLKKNVIYDLLHGHRLDHIHPESRYQFYDVTRLWDDIECALRLDLSLLHVTSEPLSCAAVAQRVFGRQLTAPPDNLRAEYRSQSLHAASWLGRDGYLYTAEQTLSALQAFVQRVRATDYNP
jgi:nucleoside-diphosphate-sugar epimerase